MNYLISASFAAALLLAFAASAQRAQTAKQVPKAESQALLARARQSSSRR
jgi:hypothetical protein